MENILEKTLNFLSKLAAALENLSTKTSVPFDHKNIAAP